MYMSRTSSSNDQELPSSVGVGWQNISVDDPERDKRILTSNTMRELCRKPEEDIAIEGIPTIQAFDRRYIEKSLKSFEKQTHYIQRLSNGRIRLTDIGRSHCSEFV
jgi:hypothetical protein